MIENWEIINRIDAQKNILFRLLMDGTEQDARLMSKKLKGYVQEVRTAKMPYTHELILPNNLDEVTQGKIRTAIQEVVDLSKRIDSLVPGGDLGDPLFNFAPVHTTTESLHPLDITATAQKQLNLDEATHIGLNVHDTVRPAPTPTEGPASQNTSAEKTHSKEPQTSAKTPDVNVEQQTVAFSQSSKTPSTISISDNDMLIKDMEGSVLEKMPLEDILSAETKYDMFVDVEQPIQQTQKTQNERNHLPDAQPPQTASFNVFEHELKDEANILDIEEVQTITDRLTQKDKAFMNNTNSPQNEDQKPASVPQTNSDAPTVPSTPFTLGAAQEPPKTMMDELSSETIPEEQIIEDTLPPQSVQQRANLPEITVRESLDKLDKTFNLETTFNTEFLRQQNEKTRSLREGNPVPPPVEQEPPHTKTILRLKKQSVPEPEQESEQMGKTMLRLRRKQANTANMPTPPAAKPLRSTVSPTNSTPKQRNIDHSIQIPTSELKKHNWPLEVPLIPTYTLNNMVMSVNRFAHATAVSVIENPGKLYNPLVLHGATGTGKTHFLNALAYAFSKKFGQEHIFMTNGVRLSRGIQRYVMEGNIEKFENFMKSVQALLIDDIHLLAINEQNRNHISKLLNTFLQEQKQIVITSKYPPESLEKLEELINFKLDAGWISELKPATGATHFRIVKKMLMESGVDLNDKQIEDFFNAPHMTLGTVTRSIRRLKVLENLIFPNIPETQRSSASIFEKLLATKGEDNNSELLNKDPSEITTLTMTGNGEWGRIGFFYPQNCSEMMNWMVYALGQRAKELGIEGGFEIVVRSSYATENIISSAFKIANLCDNKKLKGAVILGPIPQSCDPSVRENFYDILTHMLEIMLIRCGIINYEDVRMPSTYVKVLSELMR